MEWKRAACRLPRSEDSAYIAYGFCSLQPYTQYKVADEAKRSWLVAWHIVVITSLSSPCPALIPLIIARGFGWSGLAPLEPLGRRDDRSAGWSAELMRGAKPI